MASFSADAVLRNHANRNPGAACWASGTGHQSASNLVRNDASRDLPGVELIEACLMLKLSFLLVGDSTVKASMADQLEGGGLGVTDSGLRYGSASKSVAADSRPA